MGASGEVCTSGAVLAALTSQVHGAREPVLPVCLRPGRRRHRPLSGCRRRPRRPLHRLLAFSRKEDGPGSPWCRTMPYAPLGGTRQIGIADRDGRPQSGGWNRIVSTRRLESNVQRSARRRAVADGVGALQAKEVLIKDPTATDRAARDPLVESPGLLASSKLSRRQRERGGRERPAGTGPSPASSRIPPGVGRRPAAAPRGVCSRGGRHRDYVARLLV